MRVLAGMSVNIKYTVALFSSLDVSVREKKTETKKKACDLKDFLCILHECVANVHCNHYTLTYFILSRLSDRLFFHNSVSLSLSLSL